MPDKPTSRMEADIREILERVDLPDGPPPPKEVKGVPVHSDPKGKRPTHLRLVRTAPRRRGLASLPPVAWFGVAIVLTLVALFTSSRSQNITLILAIAAIAALIVPLFLRRTPSAGDTRGPGSITPTSRTWRGRDIDLAPPGGSNATDRVRRWIDRSRNGR